MQVISVTLLSSINISSHVEKSVIFCDVSCLLLDTIHWIDGITLTKVIRQIIFYPSCQHLFLSGNTSTKYSKTCLKRSLKKNNKIGLQLRLLLNAVSYHLPLRPLFCLFLSGRLRQVLL